MQAFAYFPALVYREEHPEWVDYTNKVCAKHFEHQAKIHEEHPLPKCFPVLQTQHMADDPELGYLTGYFRDASLAILREQGYAVDNYDFYVSGMWGQDIGCFGGHAPHVHKNSLITGLFFLETPEGGAFPVFHDPRPGKLMCDLDPVPSNDVTPAMSQVFFNNMVPGTFLLFNSWLPHQLMPSSSEQSTKFIHFTLSHTERRNQCST